MDGMSAGATSAAGASETDLVPQRAPEPRISETDLALIEALQAAPRAAWSEIGKALDLDATTAARRWERLRAAGLAWITGYDSAKTTTVAFVEVRCRPQQLDTVSAAASALPWVFSVDETAGDFDLLLSVGATDLAALGRWTRRDLGGLDGVRSIRTRIGITLYGEGSDWRVHAMEPARLAELSPERRSSQTAYGTAREDRMSPATQALYKMLGENGRASYTDLGAAAGISEYTARRRIHRMLREGDLILRCDLAYPLAGLPVTAIYRMSVPHGELEAIGRVLARQHHVRMCASVSGPHNLLVHVLLHGLHGIDAFESRLAAEIPRLEVKDRTLTLRTVKRMGWLLDDAGRAVRRVPLGPPAQW